MSGPKKKRVQRAETEDAHSGRVVLAEMRAKGRYRRPSLQEPPSGWKLGLEDLILFGRCPFCSQLVKTPTVTAEGLGWDCAQGCNP